MCEKEVGARRACRRSFFFLPRGVFEMGCFFSLLRKHGLFSAEVLTCGCLAFAFFLLPARRQAQSSWPIPPRRFYLPCLYVELVGIADRPRCEARLSALLIISIRFLCSWSPRSCPPLDALASPLLPPWAPSPQHRFQVGELRKHQLLETKVRCYAIRHERLTCNSPDDPTCAAAAANGLDGSTLGGGSSSGEPEEKCPDQVFFQCHSMRLQHPDDELGGNMLLVIPQVCHRCFRQDRT